jgi:hypothetical protein
MPPLQLSTLAINQATLVIGGGIGGFRRLE